MLPPGRARFATKPTLTGSETRANTIGSERVCWPSAANASVAVWRQQSRPALALSLIRAGVRDSLDQTTQEAITRTLADSHRVFTGADIEEGIDAFFAKRAPVFTAGRSGAREYKRNETEAGALYSQR
jgi:hypothetical protein